jgi:hypothetical protein
MSPGDVGTILPGGWTVRLLSTDILELARIDSKSGILADNIFACYFGWFI